MNNKLPAVFSRFDRFALIALLVLLLANLAVSNRAHTHEVTAHMTAIHAMADASLYAGHAVLATSMTADPQNAAIVGHAAGAWLPAGQDLATLIGVEKANMLANTRYSAAAGELSVVYAITSTVLGLLSCALCAYLTVRVLLPQKRASLSDVEARHE